MDWQAQKYLIKKKKIQGLHAALLILTWLYSHHNTTSGNCS